MIAAGIGLALLSAVIHGTWNVMVKVSGDPLAIFQRATVAAWLVISMPVAAAWLTVGRPGFALVPFALCLLSATLETVYLWLLATAYRRGDLSVVYPIARGSAPLLAVIAGVVLIGERLTPLQMTGVGFLLIGILGVSLAQARGRATLPAVLTGVAIAAYTSVDRVGVRLVEPWLYGWLLVTLIAVELSATVWLAGRLKPEWKGGGAGVTGFQRAALIGLFMWGGYFIVLWALTFAPLALIAPVRETSIIGVAVWGVWRLHERGGAALKLSGAAAALAGVILLAI
jgi:multidrug transporter EmrE-like cation transporter